MIAIVTRSKQASFSPGAIESIALDPCCIGEALRAVTARIGLTNIDQVEVASTTWTRDDIAKELTIRVPNYPKQQCHYYIGRYQDGSPIPRS